MPRLLRWLNQNETVIKAGGLGTYAGLNASGMSNVVSGNRMPRPATVAKLLEGAAKYGFDKSQEYETN